jgi:hydroxymethylpyrimidine pyrophosphatase-like HAD family hydrolase
MRRGCSKASGVKEAARHFAIPLSEVMTIGDNTNDIPMLHAAGWSVAMGHAPEPVRASAKAITASNREDGAALAIERYVL